MKQVNFINELISTIKENKNVFRWTDESIVKKILEMESYFDKDKTLTNLIDQLK